MALIIRLPFLHRLVYLSLGNGCLSVVYFNPEDLE